MDLRLIFKETMTYMEVRPCDLAFELKRSRKHISAVRNGRSSLPLNEFDKYLEACELLKPGFNAEFASRLLEIGVSGDRKESKEEG